MTNGSGPTTFREVDMAVYDRLPKQVRRIIDDAPFAISCQSVTSMARRRGMENDELMEYLRDFIERETRRQAAEFWGYDHPLLEGKT